MVTAVSGAVVSVVFSSVVRAVPEAVVSAAG